MRGLMSLTGQLASVDEDLTGRENLILLGRLLGLKRSDAKARRRAARGVRARRRRGPTRQALLGRNATAPRHRGEHRRHPDVMFLGEPTTGLDPRSRNQVWDIIRTLVGEGTTILLCTQYLDEADQLADGIAVIDHGKVIAEGTPGQLKASVGLGALRVRLLDPEQRAEAERALAGELGSVNLDPDPPRSRLRAPTRTELPRPSPSSAARGADRRLLARPAEPRRSVPRPDRPPRRGAGGGRPGRDPGGGRMSTGPATKARGADATDQAAVRKAISSGTRPPRASALSAALTFGWRGMLKVKHVPEQLLDVTITPVMFVLMFTYLFEGATGSTSAYLDYILPGMLVMSVLFTTVYSGVALNTDLTKGVVDRFRSLPIFRPVAAPRCAARGQRSLRHRRDGDRGTGSDPGLPAPGDPSAGCSRRWRWWWCSPSACPGSSPRSGS